MKPNIIVSMLMICIKLIVAQDIVKREPAALQIIPRPQKIIPVGRSVLFDEDGILTVTAEGQPTIKKAIHYLQKRLDDKLQGKIKLSVIENSNPGPGNFHLKLVMAPQEQLPDNSQYYQIRFDARIQQLEISAASQLALLYGIVTFSEFLHREDHRIILDLVDVEDWPFYQRRIFPAVPIPGKINELMDFALRNKIETIALPSRQYSWKNVSPVLAGIFKAIKAWREMYGGPHIMQSYNLYEKEAIVISDRDDIDHLKTTIETGILNGADRLMILADDTPPFQFGEGYVLTDERDKAVFAHMAAAHCHLLTEIRDWLDINKYKCEIYYVPAFYTFEDAKYGDMFLYQNTPWQADAFAPLYRDLAYIGEHMPSDVFIIWTGPYVRSRAISDDDLRQWTALLSGRVPFLWDNTIYSHHPFTSTALFTAFQNKFPQNFQQKTAGNGLFVNSDAFSEDMKTAVLTSNDYLWQPVTYEPEHSLHLALKWQFGEDLVEALLAWKEVELALRKKIGERALWYQADTLWKAIIDTKTITAKNPFYYHLNYSRLKALRMQLKHSAPQPAAEKDFIESCKILTDRRNNLLREINAVRPQLAEYLRKIMVSAE